MQSILSFFSLALAGIGAYYVIKTFREQEKATQSQLELARMQIELHRMELMPFLVFKDQINFTNYEWDDQNLVQQQVQFEVQKNCMKNLEIVIEFCSELITFRLPDLQVAKIWLPKELVSFNFAYDQQQVNEEIMYTEFHNVYSNILIKYSDLVGTRYEQKFVYEPTVLPQINPACRVG
ncbi:hypothetical protein [Desertivirga xinjiangensis]|uniref:hypothetical protein n=1 Tax=Desertivirga xinjiangensis TaxID=539206 RepID=UPI00210C17CD|nr:hypothetical protein [Pedobacter xinjiangensis]